MDLKLVGMDFKIHLEWNKGSIDQDHIPLFAGKNQAKYHNLMLSSSINYLMDLRGVMTKVCQSFVMA